MAAVELQRTLQPDEERDDANDAAPDPKDNGPEQAFDFREIRLHTEPVVHERGVLHWMAGALGFQYDDETGVHATNEILTARYTLITFLPKNLFMQFTRLANLYFLLIAGLQLIPGLSPTSWFTTVFPLCCVLIINAIKEIVDDLGRHRSDQETNSRLVLLLSRGGMEDAIQWRDIRCGHVVKIRQDEEVPADCIILSTSDETHLCHVETANLDGETNLKLKYAFEGTKTVHTADQLKEFEERLAVHTEMPNTKLYNFDGSVVDVADPEHNQLALTVDNLLLRGCTLRKTNWVIGLVVFTGADSKIMMNRTPAKRKVTQLERHMNILVLCMFSAQFFISAMMATGGQVYQQKNQDMWYLQWTGEWPDLYQGFGAWVIQVIRWIIVLNGMIPISLYVTLEMVKVIQCAWILNSDRQLYLADTDTAFRCRTTNLNEDLGQVEYVLSDKTGTLTQNVMGFVWASINQHLYGKSDLSAIPVEHQANVKAGKPGLRPSHVPEKTAHSLLLDPELQAKLGKPFALLAGNSAGTTQTPPDDAVATFFICLAVCNTVVPQVLEDGRFVYQASSPDEEALVEGAAMAGYKLVSRSTTQCEVEYHGQRHVYKTLVVLEFNSDRKRMSIICKCPDGKIRLFSKGADTMMMTRIAQNQPITVHVRRHLADMAQVGYRTLVIAQKEITNDNWNTWWSTYHAASVAIEDREHKIAQAAERIESELDLLGATAVEDKLQDGVPDAISKMVDAGIKVWVLTGDKVETAISIAFSCRLFTDNMAIVELRDRDFERAMAQAGVQRSNKTGRFNEAVGGTMDQVVEVEASVLKMKLDEVHAENIRLHAEADNRSLRMSMMRADAHGQDVASQSTHVGLVIEGGALAVGLQKEHQDLLIQLLSSCKSVVCCRVSPMQKAAVTKLVQVKCKAIVLGIGDGANDVGMIQAAHIGCGISGREGRAAVMASDYSFAQFRFVARLLLVHGRSAYVRNAEVVIYSFYKNWLWNWTYVYFAFVTVWSAQPLYTSGLIATFNLFWAALPIVIYAFTEQEVSQETLMNVPMLYGDSMRANRKTFLFSQLQWLGLAQWHSLVNYFVPMYSMGMTNDSHGRATNWVDVGCTVYTAMIFTVNLKVAMRTRYWTWMNHVSIWAISIALWFPFLYLYGLVWPVAQVDGTADMSDIAVQLFPNPFFWLGGVLLAPALSLLLDIAIMTFRKHLNPKPAEILQEYEYQEEIKKQALKELGLGYTATQQSNMVPPKFTESNSILGRADMPSRSVVVTELQAIDHMEPPAIALKGAQGTASGALLLP